MYNRCVYIHKFSRIERRREARTPRVVDGSIFTSRLRRHRRRERSVVGLWGWLSEREFADWPAHKLPQQLIIPSDRSRILTDSRTTHPARAPRLGRMEHCGAASASLSLSSFLVYNMLHVAPCSAYSYSQRWTRATDRQQHLA